MAGAGASLGGAMNVSQFSRLTGLSAYTLRYYEKIGLLKNIQRRANGHRTYSQRDAQWVAFIVRLKDTGMALENILQYAALREAGSATLAQRQVLLEAHREQLKMHIALQQDHLDALEEKINLYQNDQVA